MIVLVLGVSLARLETPALAFPGLGLTSEL